MFDGVDDLAVAGLIFTTADWSRTVYDRPSYDPPFSDVLSGTGVDLDDLWLDADRDDLSATPADPFG